jgi:PII-like signaling protein
MLENGPALKVTIHLNRDTGATRGFLVDDVFVFLQSNGIEGATMLQPHAGHGSHRQPHTTGAGDVAGLHLPVIIHFVERQEKVESILKELLAMVTDGLVEAHLTTMLKNATSSSRVIV